MALLSCCAFTLQMQRMRIVLSSFGTLGDIHPLIALALELRRRGHVPVLAVPELFRAKIVSLGLEFAPVGPILDPENNQLVAMLMDIRKGTERTLREILFPAIRQSYRELLAVVEAMGRRPAACRRAGLPGPHRGRGYRDPVGVARARAAVFFFPL